MNIDALSLLDEIIYIVDIETHDILYMNDKCITALGLLGKKYIGAKCYNVVQHLDAPCSFCTTPYISEDKFYEWEHYNPAVDRYYHIKDKKIFYQGRSCRFEMAVDVTELKMQTQRAVNHGRSLEVCVPGSVCMLNEDFRVIWYSDSFLDFIGYTRQQYEDELQGSLGYMHPEDMPDILEKASQVRKTGELLYFPVRYFKRGGDEGTMIASLVYRKEVDQGLYYSMGIDITDYVRRIAAEGKSLAAALETAQKANLAKSHFLSRMSHELRTPLNGIIGMSQVALTSADSRDVVEEAQRKICNAAKYLLALLNDILDMANIESGAFELQPDMFYLGELLGDIYSVHWQEANSRNIEFSIHLEYFPDEHLSADCVRIKQALGNLLANAIKFTQPGGKVTLRVRKYSQEPGTVWLEFIIVDNGIGMSADFLDKIFVPFLQEDEGSVTANKGVGLGLPIARYIVRKMNGVLELQSNKDVGTCCTMRVPLGHATDWKKELNPEYRRLLSALRLLVIDDEEGCANMQNMADVHGFTLDTARSASDGLNALRKAVCSNTIYDMMLISASTPHLQSSGFMDYVRGKVTSSPFLLSDDDTESNCPGASARGYKYAAVAVTSFDKGHALAQELSTEFFFRRPYFARQLLQLLSRVQLLPVPPDPTEKKNYDFSGKRILLVEDNEINSEVACELLSKMCHFSIDTAENGKIAVEMFDAMPEGYYHLVLMDICMPVMDGLEASRTIRGNAAKGGQYVPIVALSANSFEEDRERSRESGINAHMAKPLDMNALCPVLAELLH